jgi:hypothetical protein
MNQPAAWLMIRHCAAAAGRQQSFGGIRRLITKSFACSGIVARQFLRIATPRPSSCDGIAARMFGLRTWAGTKSD